MSYIWWFLKVGPDQYAAYRDGQFYHNMSSKQILQDVRFRYDHANLIHELKENGEAMREIFKSSIRQLNPFSA